MAGRQGFEPRSDGPEPPVLPLDDLPALRVILEKQTGRFKPYHSDKASEPILLDAAADNFGPRIAQRNRAIEYRFARAGIRIHAKIAQPFELIPLAGLRFSQAWLHAARSEDLKRIRIQVGFKIFPILFIGRIFNRK